MIPQRRHFDAFPREFGEWSCAAPVSMDKAIEANLGVTDYLLCDFVRQDPPALVSVYLGYHERQVREEGGGSGENSIHPPAHCLPGLGLGPDPGRDRVRSTCPACRSDRPA